MIHISNMNGKVVYQEKPAKDGGVTYKKVGKIHLTVFSPNGRRVVGYMVKRPDVALMFARADVFVAFDSLTPYDKGYVISGVDPTDKEAQRRLNLDWDRCLLWSGMDAITESGKTLGYVGDAEFDPQTGAVRVFCIGDGGAATRLVGAVEIPVSMMVGYENGFMKVRDEAASIQPSGGAAARAGESYAKAKQGAKVAGAKAGKRMEEAGAAADKAVQKGGYELGKAIGKAGKAVREATDDGSSAKSAGTKKKPASGGDAAKAAGRQIGQFGKMFKDFKDEFDEASK